MGWTGGGDVGCEGLVVLVARGSRNAVVMFLEKEWVPIRRFE